MMLLLDGNIFDWDEDCKAMFMDTLWSTWKQLFGAKTSLIEKVNYFFEGLRGSIKN